MTQTALILGSSGRLGHHAAEAFTRAGWTVRRFDRAADKLPFLDLPEAKATVQACKKMAARFKEADNLIIQKRPVETVGPPEGSP